MNRRQLSTGRSSVSSDGPRADTAAIIKGLSSRGEQMAEGRTKAPPLGPICADPLRSEKRTKSISRSKRSEAMQPRQLHQTVLSTARTETRSASKGTRFIRGNAATRVAYRRSLHCLKRCGSRCVGTSRPRHAKRLLLGSVAEEIFPISKVQLLFSDPGPASQEAKGCSLGICNRP
jgi:hypothetical protein